MLPSPPSFTAGSPAITTVLRLAPAPFLADMRASLAAAGMVEAVVRHDTPAIFDWLLAGLKYQGISDASADAFAHSSQPVSWHDLDADLNDRPSCSRLLSYWHFAECGYRKTERVCAELHLLSSCPLPSRNFRNGRLSQAAYSLFLFMRDVCDGDFVGWLDSRLEAVDRPGVEARGGALRDAIIEPMTNIHGVSHKVLSMALSGLLLAGDLSRERWQAAGASMIAVDTLVHNFLHRTGTLRRFAAQHAYGDACYSPAGCASIIEIFAAGFDARTINPVFPRYFPRLVQFAIWNYCAQGGLNICNGNTVDDRQRCANRFCPAFFDCERIALKPRLGNDV